MHKILALAAALLFAVAAPAMAAPIPYVNVPMDTPNSAVNNLIGNLNGSSGLAAAQGVVTGSGTTAITASGLKIVASYTGLTTAAGVTSALTTITNTSVTASSLIFCDINGYGGTGNPRATNVIPAAGSFTVQIQNTHASAALNATVPIACMVYN